MNSPTESLETLNQRLKDLFGLDTVTGQAMWRIVNGDDEMEYRHGLFEDYTPSGLFIRAVTETRLVPKYRQMNAGCYILERLVQVPAQQQVELGGKKISYEPIFVYKSFKYNKPLPPVWEVTELVINSVLVAQGNKNGFAKYKDKTPEEKEKDIMLMMDYLYGDRNNTTDALAYKEGVVVPNNYEVN